MQLIFELNIQNRYLTKMDENEIQIGDKKIGMNTEIKFSVKTLMFILAILFSLLTALFTWFYFNNQERENELRKEMKTILREYNSDIKTDIKALEQQVFMLAQGQGEIKTDLRTVINQQMGLTERHSNYFNNSNRAVIPNGPR